MLIIGFSHLRKKDYFLPEKTKDLLSEAKFQSYQKGLILPYFFTGTLMICMAIVERSDFLQTSTFIILYTILGSIPIIMLIVNNKINTGRYWFWLKNI